MKIHNYAVSEWKKMNFIFTKKGVNIVYTFFMFLISRYSKLFDTFRFDTSSFTSKST